MPLPNNKTTSRNSNDASLLSAPTVIGYFQEVSQLIPRLPYQELDRIITLSKDRRVVKAVSQAFPDQEPEGSQCH